MKQKKWTGRKFKAVYGVDCGDVYKITSEPYACNRKGTLKV